VIPASHVGEHNRKEGGDMRLTKEQLADYRDRLSTMGLGSLEGFDLFDTIDALERDLDAAVELRTKEATAHTPMIAIDDTASKVWVYCACGFNKDSTTYETDPEKWTEHILRADRKVGQ
jgi:hypothetical protein